MGRCYIPQGDITAPTERSAPALWSLYAPAAYLPLPIGSARAL